MEDNPQAPQQQPAQNRQQQSGSTWPQENQEWYQYLLQLSDALRAVDDPTAIEEIATRLAMQSLDADRCYYCRVVDGQAIISRDARRGHLPSVAGTYPLSSFPLLKKVVEEGRPFIVEDAHTTPLLDEELRAICLQMHVIAFLNIPVSKQGKPIGVLCLVQSAPRRWTELEIQLQIETAERTWAAVERARFQEALRDSEARLQVALGAAQLGTFIWHVAEDRTEEDAMARLHFGLPVDGSISLAEALVTTFHPEDAPRYAAAVAHAIDPAGPGMLNEEFRVRYPDGRERWLAVQARAAFEGTSRMAVRLTGVLADVTERKRMEESLRQANRRKDEFLAMLAHELRNPMATLHNTLLVLELTQGQDESLPLDRALAMMSREVIHLNRMVDDLLDVGRISQGKVQLKKGRLDLSGLIREAVEATRTQFSSQRHSLAIQLPQTPIWVNGDRTRLTQVVRNLLTNAAKYTPPGGQIRVQLQNESRQAVLRIRDNGIGLAADQLEAIFEVFVQVSSSLDRPQGGLGLGLAVVQQLIQLHGGQVGVESGGLGQGSEFIVRLPLFPDASVSTASSGVDEGSAQQAGRIVVVDDNADLALTTAMLLRVKNYEAHTCLSGLEALTVVETLQPDAVLLDLGMPDMDGYETCRRLRELAWGQQGVIVALSGYGQEEDKKRTQAVGFDGHLVKPVNLQTLTALLATLLNTDPSSQ